MPGHDAPLAADQAKVIGELLSLIRATAAELVRPSESRAHLQRRRQGDGKRAHDLRSQDAERRAGGVARDGEVGGTGAALR